MIVDLVFQSRHLCCPNVHENTLVLLVKMGITSYKPSELGSFLVAFGALLVNNEQSGQNMLLKLIESYNCSGSCCDNLVVSNHYD